MNRIVNALAVFTLVTCPLSAAVKAKWSLWRSRAESTGEGLPLPESPDCHAFPLPSGAKAGPGLTTPYPRIR